MSWFKLPNGLAAQVLCINDRNGKIERWPQQVLRYANSYVVKINVQGYLIGLVFSENCLYQYKKCRKIRRMFLPPGINSVKALVTKHFKPAVRVSSLIVYSGVAYGRGGAARHALETAVLTGVPPSVCVLVAAAGTDRLDSTCALGNSGSGGKTAFPQHPGTDSTAPQGGTKSRICRYFKQ